MQVGEPISQLGPENRLRPDQDHGHGEEGDSEDRGGVVGAALEVDLENIVRDDLEAPEDVAFGGGDVLHGRGVDNVAKETHGTNREHDHPLEQAQSVHDVLNVHTDHTA